MPGARILTPRLARGMTPQIWRPGQAKRAPDQPSRPSALIGVRAELEFLGRGPHERDQIRGSCSKPVPRAF